MSSWATMWSYMQNDTIVPQLFECEMHQTLFNPPLQFNLSHAHILGKESCEITLESGGLIVHPVNANIGMPSSAWASKILLLDPLAMGVKWTPPAVATGWYANLQITKLQENSEQCKFWEYTNELYYLPGHLWWGDVWILPVNVVDVQGEHQERCKQQPHQPTCCVQ